MMFSPDFSDVMPWDVSLENFLLPRRDYDTNVGYQLSRRLIESSTKNMFQCFFNVSQFTPEELEINIVDNFIVIHGKHDEKTDEHGFVSREFTRRVRIPDDVEPHTIKSVFKRNAVLIIKAPRKVIKPASDRGRIIPIEMQKPLASEKEMTNGQQASSLVRGTQTDVQQLSEVLKPSNV